MAGRRPLPTALKLVRGNPGKRALPVDEPTPAPGATAPAYLSPVARRQWAVIARQLTAAGMLSRVDASALALYCDAFARWTEAKEKVAELGRVIEAPPSFRLVANPWTVLEAEAWRQMARQLTEFGMTPSSRSRVTRIGDGDDKRKPANKAASYF